MEFLTGCLVLIVLFAVRVNVRTEDCVFSFQFLSLPYLALSLLIFGCITCVVHNPDILPWSAARKTSLGEAFIQALIHGLNNREKEE